MEVSYAEDNLWLMLVLFGAHYVVLGNVKEQVYLKQILTKVPRIPKRNKDNRNNI